VQLRAALAMQCAVLRSLSPVTCYSYCSSAHSGRCTCCSAALWLSALRAPLCVLRCGTARSLRWLRAPRACVRRWLRRCVMRSRTGLYVFRCSAAVRLCGTLRSLTCFTAVLRSLRCTALRAARAAIAACLHGAARSAASFCDVPR
jgi:hypothetical protein